MANDFENKTNLIFLYINMFHSDGLNEYIEKPNRDITTDVGKVLTFQSDDTFNLQPLTIPSSTNLTVASVSTTTGLGNMTNGYNFQGINNTGIFYDSSGLRLRLSGTNSISIVSGQVNMPTTLNLNNSTQSNTNPALLFNDTTSGSKTGIYGNIDGVIAMCSNNVEKIKMEETKTTFKNKLILDNSSVANPQMSFESGGNVGIHYASGVLQFRVPIMWLEINGNSGVETIKCNTNLELTCPTIKDTSVFNTGGSAFVISSNTNPFLIIENSTSGIVYVEWLQANKRDGSMWECLTVAKVSSSNLIRFIFSNDVYWFHNGNQTKYLYSGTNILITAPHDTFYKVYCRTGINSWYVFEM